MADKQPTATKPNLISIERAAQYLEVSVSTVRRWIREGKVRAYPLDEGIQGVSIEELVKAPPGSDQPLCKERRVGERGGNTRGSAGRPKSG
jgi:excisionase family DNA binding protein